MCGGGVDEVMIMNIVCFGVSEGIVIWIYCIVGICEVYCEVLGIWCIRCKMNLEFFFFCWGEIVCLKIEVVVLYVKFIDFIVGVIRIYKSSIYCNFVVIVGIIKEGIMVDLCFKFCVLFNWGIGVGNSYYCRRKGNCKSWLR